MDAGSKTLTTTMDPVYGYGHLAGRPDATVTRLSEEHGVLSVAGPPPAVGDVVRILPVHVCVWSDLQPEVYGTRHGEIVDQVRIVQHPVAQFPACRACPRPWPAPARDRQGRRRSAGVPGPGWAVRTRSAPATACWTEPTAIARAVPKEIFRTTLVTTPYPDLFELHDLGQRGQRLPRDGTGAQQGQAPRAGPGQLAGRHGGDRAGPHRGDVGRVEDRPDRVADRVEGHDQAGRAARLGAQVRLHRQHRRRI